MKSATFSLTVAAIWALVSVSESNARVVEYLPDRAAVEAAAGNQGIAGPFSDTPSHGKFRLALEAPAAADHNAKIASVYCQAYKVENIVSTLMQSLILAADKDGKTPDQAQSADLTIRLLKGSTLFRCFVKGEFGVICKGAVRLAAEVYYRTPDGSVASMPINANVEREGRIGGLCGHIARYIGIITREAGIDLIRQAEKIAPPQ